MRRITFLFIFLLLLTVPVQAETTVYGKGVHLEQATRISELLDNPDRFVGQQVKISGMIIEVCAKRGCWIYLAGDRPYEKIQVKVTDGEIVFPMSASGRMAVVEGIVDELDLPRREVIRYKKHLAEEQGLPFDPASVKQGEKIIRLIGIGAEIED